MALKDQEKRVKHPHPLMQQGTPTVDVESDHILKFTVFRMTGTGNPVHVATLDQPLAYTDPADVNRLVGGGRYQIKALANALTSGRQQSTLLATTQYEWDGAPIIKSPTPNAQPAQPATTVTEQVKDNLPVYVSALSTVATTVLGFLTEARNARASEEQRRREYEDARRREEQAERDRREAKERAEAEERRAEREREAEERRQQWQREMEERRDRDRIDAEARAARASEEARLREQQQQAMLNAILTRQDPNDAVIQTLLGRALERQPPPPSATDEAAKLIDTAQKLKNLQEGGSEKEMLQFLGPLLASPAGQQVIGRLLSVVGLHDRPQQAQEAVVHQPPEPPVVAQIPEQVPQVQPEQPPPIDGVSVGGPVSLN